MHVVTLGMRNRDVKVSIVVQVAHANEMCAVCCHIGRVEIEFCRAAGNLNVKRPLEARSQRHAARIEHALSQDYDNTLSGLERIRGGKRGRKGTAIIAVRAVVKARTCTVNEKIRRLQGCLVHRLIKPDVDARGGRIVHGEAFRVEVHDTGRLRKNRRNRQEQPQNTIASICDG